MGKKAVLIITLCMALFSFQAIASESQEKIYLVQMINQLEALKPLVLAAAREQDKNTRIQFHYSSYRDTVGKLQNGLLEDINEIKKGIQEKLNQTSSEPHRFQAIRGDYVDDGRIK